MNELQFIKSEHLGEEESPGCKKRRYTVYMHTNKINGKRYIGITFNPIARRWENGKAYEHCKRFNKAIQDYGWENFTHEIVAIGLSEDAARGMERELITRYRSDDEKHGYNISPGGGIVSESTKQMLSMKRKGENNPFFGRKHSEEAKRKISAHSKTMVGSMSSQSKRVRCLNTGEVFESMVLAAKKYGINHPSDISKVCRRKAKSRGKDKNGNPLYWEYAKTI